MIPRQRNFAKSKGRVALRDGLCGSLEEIPDAMAGDDGAWGLRHGWG
jgi:hypothetical protein